MGVWGRVTCGLWQQYMGLWLVACVRDDMSTVILLEQQKCYGISYGTGTTKQTQML